MAKAKKGEDMQVRTVYLRHTNASGCYVTEHRAWDAERFIAAQHAAVAEVNAGRARGEQAGKIEEITEDDFRKESHVNRRAA